MSPNRQEVTILVEPTEKPGAPASESSYLRVKSGERSLRVLDRPWS